MSWRHTLGQRLRHMTPKQAARLLSRQRSRGTDQTILLRLCATTELNERQVAEAIQRLEAKAET